MCVHLLGDQGIPANQRGHACARLDRRPKVTFGHRTNNTEQRGSRHDRDDGLQQQGRTRYAEPILDIR